MQIAAMNPVAVDDKSVDKSVIEKELEIAKAQILAEGKPENMVEKIAQGKLSKFFKENTLLAQAFVKDNSKTVAQYLDSVSKGLTVSEFRRVAIGK
jgi:elongation factor Ts